MPWNIKQGAAGCKGYAVVKETGELVGCHPTKSAASAHLKALYANEVEKANPCWDGYEMIGWKTQNGKRVPNCVPVKKIFISRKGGK
jgi:hypothetical protein